MLVEKVKIFLKDYSLKTLCIQSWVHESVILSLIKWEHKKYHRNILDILYAFFNLKKDAFYRENMKKWYPKTESLLWTLVRFKRVRMDIDLQVLAKQIKMSDRALARIESGDSLPYYNSWSIQHIMEVLRFSDSEKKMVADYIDVMKKIEKMVQKYEI